MIILPHMRKLYTHPVSIVSSSDLNNIYYGKTTSTFWRMHGISAKKLQNCFSYEKTRAHSRLMLTDWTDL